MCDRAAGRVALQRLEVEGLGDHALGREGRIAVEQDRHGGHRVVLQAPFPPGGLRGARGAGHHWVDVLEVARIRVEAHPDLGAILRLVDALVAVVVLDVAGAAGRDGGQRLDRLDRLRPLELGEDRLNRPPDVVGEHAEASAVGHADHDVVSALRVGHLEDLVEHRHHRVEALDREHLLARGRPSPGSARSRRPGSGDRAAPASPRARAACDASRSRSCPAATSAAGARRGARSGRRSSRSRPRASAAAPPAASPPRPRSGGSRPGPATSAPASG